MARPFLLLGLAAASLSAVAGCVDTDPTVFVDATIRDPAAQVSAVALGTQLTGSFSLSLALGPRASGASQVTLQGFSITDADQSTTIVDALPAVTSTPLPVEVAPDETVTLTLTFDSGADLLPAEAEAALCEAAGLRITGAIQDSLQDGATPVVSELFTATCAGSGS